MRVASLVLFVASVVTGLAGDDDTASYGYIETCGG